jgi:hypothetical protein
MNLLVGLFKRNASRLAPFLKPDDPSAVIPRTYLVSLKTTHKNAPTHVRWLRAVIAKEPPEKGRNKIREVFKMPRLTVGYGGLFTDSVLLKIRRRPEVDCVEAEQYVSTMKAARNKKQ